MGESLDLFYETIKTNEVDKGTEGEVFFVFCFILFCFVFG